jgi:hypothetical protein
MQVIPNASPRPWREASLAALGSGLMSAAALGGLAAVRHR